MAESARFGYLQARLQARHGQRPSPDDWRLLEASADLVHFIDGVRATPLKRWVRAVSSDSSALEIEAVMRMAWRDAVEQAAGWPPQAWRDSILWLRWLPELPALAHLLSGLAPPPWMRVDPVMKHLAGDNPEACLEALKRSPLAPMGLALQAHGDVIRAWAEVWRQLQPDDAPEAVQADLEALRDTLDRHLRTMAAVEAETDGQRLRAALAERLTRHFRRGAGTVTALLAFLGLEGLELERLRANLVTRRLLRPLAEGRSWA